MTWHLGEEGRKDGKASEMKTNMRDESRESDGRQVMEVRGCIPDCTFKSPRETLKW